MPDEPPSSTRYSVPEPAMARAAISLMVEGSTPRARTQALGRSCRKGEAGELDQWRLTLQRHVGGGFGYAVENILTDRRRVAGGLAVNSSVAMPSLTGVSLVRAAVLSTELGMTIMSPERVRTTV